MASQVKECKGFSLLNTGFGQRISWPPGKLGKAMKGAGNGKSKYEGVGEGERTFVRFFYTSRLT